MRGAPCREGVGDSVSAGRRRVGDDPRQRPRDTSSAPTPVCWTRRGASSSARSVPSSAPSSACSIGRTAHLCSPTVLSNERTMRWIGRATESGIARFSSRTARAAGTRPDRGAGSTARSGAHDCSWMEPHAHRRRTHRAQQRRSGRRRRDHDHVRRRQGAERGRRREQHSAALFPDSVPTGMLDTDHTGTPDSDATGTFT